MINLSNTIKHTLLEVSLDTARVKKLRGILLLTLVFFVTIFLPHLTHASFIGASSVARTGSSLSTGLVGHWTFDGKDLINNVADRSGNGNHGAMVGMGATSTVSVVGAIGQGLYFRGNTTNVGVSIPNMTSSNTYTTSFWVKMKHPNERTYNSLIAASFTNGIYIEGRTAGGNSGKINYWFSPGSHYSTSAIISDKWNHVVVVSNSGSGTFYINGLSAGTITGTVPVTQFKYIGYDTAAGESLLNGSLDDVRVYSRALSATEIKQLYNQGNTKFDVTLPKQSSTGLNSGLVGHWTFDGKDLISNVADRSGNGNTGYMQNFTSTSSAVVGGKSGQALKFDGDNDRILINSDVLGTGAMTISAWIAPEKQFLRFVSNTSGNTEYIIADTNYRMLVSCGANSLSATDSISLNKWQHVAVTRDSNHLTNHYINGVLSGTANQDCGAPLSGATQTAISGSVASIENPFQGKIDDVRVYSRALTATEVNQLYNQSATKFASTPPKQSNTGLNSGLVGHWTFDGKDLINNVTDRSGNGNTGYMNNFISTSSVVVPGKLGQGLQFDGVDDYLSSSNIVNTAKVTVSAWVKITAFPVQNGMIVGFVNGIGSVTHDKNLYISTDGKIYFYVYDGATKTTSAPASTLLLNKWVHVVGVADGTNAKTYVNGVEVGSVSAGNTYTEYTVPNIFINGTTGLVSFGGGYSQQQIDDVRVWNRDLSVAEIKQLYNIGK